MSSFPLLPGGAIANSCTSEHHQKNYEECDGTEDDNKALVWDSEKCRCVESENSNEMNNAYNACVTDSDGTEKNGTDQAHCMMDNALTSAGLSNCGGLMEGSDTDDSIEHSEDANVDQCMDSLGATSLSNYSGVETWQNRLSMVNMLLSIIMWVGNRGKTKDNGMCSSTAWMTAASIAGIANELVNYFFFEKKMRQLQVDFYDKVLCDTTLSEVSTSYSSSISSDLETDVSDGCADKDPFQTQSEVFDFLYDERVFAAEIHKKKSIAYGILAGIYLTAIIAAIVQIGGTYGTGAATPCYVERGASHNNKDLFIEKLVGILSGIFALKKAFGAEENEKTTYQNNLTGGSLSGIAHFFKQDKYTCRPDELGQAEYAECMKCLRNTVYPDGSDNNPTEPGGDCSKFAKDVSLWLPLSLQILAGIGAYGVGLFFYEGFGAVLFGQILLSSAGLVLSIISAINNYFSMQEAQAQAAAIENVSEEFLDAISLYCPNGREDPEVPECYCMQEDGERRTDRENSETCQNMYAEMDQRFQIESQDLILGQNTARLSCVTIDGQPDPECNCQKFTDGKTGRNACFQVPLATGSLGNILSGTGVDEIIKDANILTGSDSTGSLGSNSNLLGAINKLTNVGKKLLNNINNKLKKNGTKTIDVSAQKVAAVMSKMKTPALLKSLKSISPSTNPISEQRDAILKKAKNKIKKTKASFSGGQGLSFNKAKGKKGGMNFDFDANGGGNKMKNFMDKKYRYKNDDIVKNDNASIWKVITNRYNNSGYPRLFED